MLQFESSTSLYDPRQRTSLACFKIGTEGDPSPSYVENTSSAVEPLLFPVLFPFGNMGFSRYNDGGMKFNMYMRQRLLNKSMPFKYMPRLVQEWIVVMYARHEDSNLDILANKQKKDRADAGFDDIASPHGSYLPSSHPQAHSFTRQRKEDLLHICNRTKGPHVMITFTANPLRLGASLVF